jgi:hypothetical protein
MGTYDIRTAASVLLHPAMSYLRHSRDSSLGLAAVVVLLVEEEAVVVIDAAVLVCYFPYYTFHSGCCISIQHHGSSNFKYFIYYNILK